MTTELLLYNGVVVTMDARFPQAEAIAFRGDRIVAVGSRVEAERAVSCHADQLDLAGRMVVPGLTDSHIHFLSWALSLEKVNLDNATSLEEVLTRIRSTAESAPPGTWLQGWGWNINTWDNPQFPTRWQLDQVTAGHPAVFSSKDGHASWANSAALQVAQIDSSTPNPKGGAIVRDSEGVPTGVFKEAAQALIRQHVPSPSLPELVHSMRKGIGEAHRFGLTSIHAPESELYQQAYTSLADQGELNLRIFAMVPLANLDSALQVGRRTGQGDEWLRTGPVKVFADGALGSRTAVMFSPYEGDPGNTGIPVVWGEELREAIQRAAMGGLATATHAIGDKANREVLDALQLVRDSSRTFGLRHRIEHAQLLHPTDIPRFAELGVIPSVQPIHCPSDRYMADKLWGDRARHAYPFRSLLSTGATLIFGSDAPVESPDPRLGLHAAITRKRADEPESAPWYPGERLSFASALYGYTMGPAFSSGEEAIKGSLTPGKLGDAVVFDRDLTAVEPEEIPYVNVAGTIVGGRFVYRSF